MVMFCTIKKLLKWVRCLICTKGEFCTRGHLCKKTFFHEGFILHKDTLARVDIFYFNFLLIYFFSLKLVCYDSFLFYFY